VLWGFGTIAVVSGQRDVIGAQKAECMGNVSVITRAITSHAASQEGQFPEAATWVQDIHPYLPPDTEQLFSCPVADEPGVGFAYNASLGRAKLEGAAAASSVVVLFESDVGLNAAGGPELLPDVPRHLGGDNYGFADGHSAWIMRKQNPDGTWAKQPEAEVRWEAPAAAPSTLHTIWGPLDPLPTADNWIALWKSLQIGAGFQAPGDGEAVVGAFYVVGGDSTGTDALVSVRSVDTWEVVGSTRIPLDIRFPDKFAGAADPPVRVPFRVSCPLRKGAHYLLLVDSMGGADTSAAEPRPYLRVLAVRSEDWPHADHATTVGFADGPSWLHRSGDGIDSIVFEVSMEER
jgi:hypothetical protein